MYVYANIYKYTDTQIHTYIPMKHIADNLGIHSCANFGEPCIHVCICMYMYVCVPLHCCANFGKPCIYVCMCIHIHIRIYIHTHTNYVTRYDGDTQLTFRFDCMHTYMHTYLHTCMRQGLFAYVYIYTYTYIYQLCHQR